MQAYVNDDGKDRLVVGDAAMGIVYNGDALVLMDENPDLEYFVPESGTNKWVDAMCIPKIAENKDYARTAKSGARSRKRLGQPLQRRSPRRLFYRLTGAGYMH